ncbi:hypothetical protein A2834_02905 [Candidatus Giovannonibacteria bacterium RIFCSPHIGHO2_01_FULL_45_23]|uniref:Lipoprotein n=1 Tax=Candidatus Giovannonibacteria bacterium RIFCSPHIGHO2_01_FULL_45_23 TaxID=1798325 RepID=A0A1F5VHP7_9BACT|nr:MAG: hypothetical protein A2834_02905 [Candidatus Giovannonibacteria bacterium RIFCSPHIGHO2_01_FULL_45_23]
MSGLKPFFVGLILPRIFTLAFLASGCGLSRFISSPVKPSGGKYNNSFYGFCILAFQSNKKASWPCNYFGVPVTKKFFESFLKKRGFIDFIKIGLHGMIKKFSSPKIKIWFELTRFAKASATRRVFL